MKIDEEEMRTTMRVLLTDHGFKSVSVESRIIAASGAELEVRQLKAAAEVLEAGRDADALLVQWAPVTSDVIHHLTRCKIIVRYGIGVDNIDLDAAREAGIPVCNVPDYCIDEVADHTMAMALSLARHLGETRAQMDGGEWKIVPQRPMPAFKAMKFGTIGFGRIARAVQKRASVFGFEQLASDPFADSSVFQAENVTRVSSDELLESADIISLHAPLTAETAHVINDRSLARMKDGAIVVNTARGGLIDTVALAWALQTGQLGGAGIDVFEEEPLPADHPLWAAPRCMLTSHRAWYSEDAVPRLQKQAAEEVVRGLTGTAMLNRLV